MCPGGNELLNLIEGVVLSSHASTIRHTLLLNPTSRRYRFRICCIVLDGRRTEFNRYLVAADKGEDVST